MAFTDIEAEKTETQDAINRFAAYGIINGYEQADGTYTFMPDATITRAEMATIIIRYTGNEVLAASLKNVPSEFSDVNGHWAAGEINAAVALGYFKGMGDGTFGVNNNVTYGQVVTLALRLAGYTDELPGAWPYDYVAQASKPATPLVKAATAFDAVADATRKDVVLVFEELLDCKPVNYDKETGEFKKSETYAKVLDKYDVVDVTSVTDIALGYNNGITINTIPVADGFTISDSFNLFDIVGLDADVVKNADGKIVHVDLNNRYIKGFVTAVDTTKNTVTVNGNVYEVASGSPVVDQYVLLDYNKDTKKVAVEELLETGNAMIVSKIEDSKISGYAVRTLTEITIGKTDKFVVVKDGAVAALADIEVGDLVYARANVGTAKAYEVLSAVGDAAISTINSVDGTNVKSAVIDGITYQTAILYKEAADTAFATLTVANYGSDKIKNAVGTFYTNKYGQAVAMVYGELTAAKNTVIGMITDATLYTESASGFGVVDGTPEPKGYSDITIVTVAGETVTYAIKDNGTKGIFEVKANTVVYDDGEEATQNGAAVAQKQLVKLTLNAEGVVTKIAVESTEEVAVNNEVGTNKVNTTLNTLTVGSTLYALGTETPVYQITNKQNGAFDVAVVKIADVIKNIDKKTINIKKNALNEAAIDYIVVADVKATDTVLTKVVVESLYADGSLVKFYGDDTLYAKATGFAANGAKVGDIVTYTTEDGKIKALTVVKAMAAIDAATPETIQAVSGNVVVADAGYVVNDKTVVFIYDDTDPDPTGDNPIIKFVGMGTLADVVKTAKIIAGDANTTGVLNYLIIVK